MGKTSKQLADWAVKKIESEFADDVCLLLEHKSLKLEKDIDSVVFGFYIPATNRANGLATTFIIDGIGHDLFPMSWESVESMADVKHYNTTCLGDAKILWARSDEDRQRFVSLQARLQANLQNPQYMIGCAKKWLETATEVYRETLFEDRLCKIRENAGYICDLLSIAVAFANLRYFVHGQTNQLQEFSGMKKLPKDFVELYRNIIMQQNPDTQKHLCHRLITNTKEFFCTLEKPAGVTGVCDFSELANWYQELCYTWRRVYHWCEENDPVNAYIWSCMLQNEVDEWGAKFGITDTDILSSYDSNDLTGFRKRAEKVELGFRQAIEKNGVKLNEFKTIEDFLAAN